MLNRGFFGASFEIVWLITDTEARKNFSSVSLKLCMLGKNACYIVCKQ